MAISDLEDNTLYFGKETSEDITVTCSNTSASFMVQIDQRDGAGRRTGDSDWAIMANGLSTWNKGPARLKIPKGTKWSCETYSHKPDVYFVALEIADHPESWRGILGVVLRQKSYSKLRRDLALIRKLEREAREAVAEQEQAVVSDRPTNPPPAA